MGKCIYLRKGEIHTPPVAGIKASDLPIGQVVKLMEGGVETEFIVVNQGVPENSSLYDASCNGTWLLRKDILIKSIWSNNTSAVSYTASNFYDYFENTYFPTLGTVEQSVIKQVNIPSRYRAGTTDEIRQTSVKVFLLSAYELGGDVGYVDGAKLNYFEAGDAGNAKRKAQYEGQYTSWCTRTSTGNSIYAVYYGDGSFYYNDTDVTYGGRPALILPFTAKFNSETKVLVGG